MKNLLILATLAAIIAVLILPKSTKINIPTAQPVASVVNGLGKIILATKPPIPKTEFIKPGAAHLLPSARWIPQTFNNCGPAATSMVLQYFGHNISQAETKAKLRTNSDDKNVFIQEISDYLKNDYGIESKVFINGDLETIKTLLANDIYVVVEAWLRPNEDIGHVLIIRGFDDTEGVLIGDDSYFGTGIKYPYKTWVETQWKPYGLEFMPVYKREKEEIVRAIVGENWEERKMHQNSVKENLAITAANGNDAIAWFNLGASYFYLGEFEKSARAFEKADSLGLPKRMLWYRIEPVQVYNRLGDFRKTIRIADRGLAGNETFAELHYEKGIAFKGLGENENAIRSLDSALRFDPDFEDAGKLREGF